MVKIQKNKKDASKVVRNGVLIAIVIIVVVSFSSSDETTVGELLKIDITADVVGDGPELTKSEGIVIDSDPSLSLSFSSREGEGEVTGLKPIRCDDFLELGYRQPGDKLPKDLNLNPNDDKLYARYTRSLEHKFWISIHEQEFDEALWESIPIGTAVYNKTSLTEALIESIKTTPGRIIDVGGQMGWFSLLARAMGMHADVFEALPANTFRICESLYLNKWTNFNEKSYPGPYVNVYNYAVVDDKLKTKTQTQSSFSSSPLTMKQRGASAGLDLEGDTSFSVDTITLDDFAIDHRKWTAQDTTISVLKINVDGLEPQVIAGASKLLQSRMVQNILIPLTTVQSLEQILRAGYKLWKWGIEEGPDQNVETLSSIEQVQQQDASQLHKQLSNKITTKEGDKVYLWFRLL